MKTGTKSFIAVALVVTVVGIMAAQNQNGFLQGNIASSGPNPDDAPIETTDPFNLEAGLELLSPIDGDIQTELTITNTGTSPVTVPFEHVLYVNDIEVLRTPDSNTMEPGDSFSYNYPIPTATIYQVPPTGTVTFEVEISDEFADDNIAIVDYDLSAS